MRQSNLCLHCGTNRVERAAIEAVTTPEATETWQPISHWEFLGGVQASLETAGLSVVSESHALGHGGDRYFGLLQVANGSNPDDYGLVVGVRNSHDKSFPASLALGSSVFVCDNLAFSAEVKLARKHTINIRHDLPSVIQRAVGRLGDLRNEQDGRYNAYKALGINDATAHDLIVRAIDARVLPVTKLPEVLHEWREPRHVEFSPRNVWSLFNAVTEISKGNLELLPRRTQALHGLMDAACGLVAMAV